MKRTWRLQWLVNNSRKSAVNGDLIPWKVDGGLDANYNFSSVANIRRTCCLNGLETARAHTQAGASRVKHRLICVCIPYPPLLCSFRPSFTWCDDKSCSNEFCKDFSDQCPNQSTLACELWFTCCCLLWQELDRETIDFPFLWRAGGLGGGALALCWWRWVGGGPHQGYSLENTACSLWHGWNRSERRFVCVLTATKTSAFGRKLPLYRAVIIVIKESSAVQHKENRCWIILCYHLGPYSLDVV